MANTLYVALQAEEAEEKRIEEWIARWDKEMVLRKQLKRAKCQRAVEEPTNPEEVALRKEIQKRAKKHVKVVLRRAGVTLTTLAGP